MDYSNDQRLYLLVTYHELINRILKTLFTPSYYFQFEPLNNPYRKIMKKVKDLETADFFEEYLYLIINESEEPFPCDVAEVFALYSVTEDYYAKIIEYIDDNSDLIDIIESSYSIGRKRSRPSECVK